MKLDEFTGVGSVPAVAGMGGFQPKPRKSVVSSLIGDDDEKPKKKEKTEKTEAVEPAAPAAPTTQTEAQVEAKLQRKNLARTNTYTVEAIAEMSDAEVEAAMNAWFKFKTAQPAQPVEKVAEAAPTPITAVKPVTEAAVSSTPPSLRSYYAFESKEQPITSLTPAAMTEAQAAAMLGATATGEAPVVDVSGAGAALMNAGALPPPEPVDPRKLVEAAHKYYRPV